MNEQMIQIMTKPVLFDSRAYLHRPSELTRKLQKQDATIRQIR